MRNFSVSVGTERKLTRAYPLIISPKSKPARLLLFPVNQGWSDTHSPSRSANVSAPSQQTGKGGRCCTFPIEPRSFFRFQSSKGEGSGQFQGFVPGHSSSLNDMKEDRCMRSFTRTLTYALVTVMAWAPTITGRCRSVLGGRVDFLVSVDSVG